MKSLFICQTDYQLINAINIKKHLLPELEADIVISNNKPGTIELSKRLQNVGLFQNVYVYSDSFNGLHRYMRGNDEKNTFCNAIKGSLKNIYLNIFGRIRGVDFIINHKIFDGKKINFSQYDNLFGVETSSFYGEIYDIISKYNKCNNNFLDEGLGCYLRYALDRKHRVDTVYLYEPEMAAYKDDFFNIIKIPKINLNDKEFIRLINYVFNFKDLINIKLKNKIIFFDQNTHPMPRYLRNAGKIKRTILRNPYKKHLKDQIFYETKLELFRVLAEKLKPQKIFVKLHPRSTEEYLEDYKKNNADFFPNIFSPWEVFGCNYEIKNNIWITVYSSALCSYDFTIKNTNNNKYIFLYKIVNQRGGLKDYKDIDEFFTNFQQLNNGKVFLPNSIDELMDNINLIISKDKDLMQNKS